MQDYTKRNQNGSINLNAAATYDAGLRSHMINVYNKMTAGLAISGVVAYIVSNSPALASILMSQGLSIAFFLGLLGMAFFVMPKIYTMSVSAARLTFYGYALLLSLAISPAFLMYTQESIARVFFITSAIFLSMSLYGYTTKKDLTNIGSFAMIGLFGVIIASVVNIFLKSNGMSFIISIAVVIISIALTAWNTQNIKQTYYQVPSNDKESLEKAAIIGAAGLYADYVNLFINLLRLLGDRR